MNPVKKIEEAKKTDRAAYYKKIYYNARNHFIGDMPDTIDPDHPECFIPANHDLGIYLMTAHACEMLMDLHERLDKIEEKIGLVSGVHVTCDRGPEKLKYNPLADDAI